jgi:hypothetical protein
VCCRAGFFLQPEGLDVSPAGRVSESFSDLNQPAYHFGSRLAFSSGLKVRPHPEGLQDRATRADLAHARERKSCSDERRRMIAFVDRYVRASKQVWSRFASGDVAVSMDATRVSGREILPLCFLEPNSGVAHWAPVQAFLASVRLNDVSDRSRCHLVGQF